MGDLQNDRNKHEVDYDLTGVVEISQGLRSSRKELQAALMKAKAEKEQLEDKV